MISVRFIEGVIDKSEMKKDTVYVDGSVRGTVVDPINGYYSFDHHGEEQSRLATNCSTQQVFNAIILGFNPENMDEVVVNHTDADSVLAVALLRNPELVKSYGKELATELESLSRLDSNGPAAVLPEEGTKAYVSELRPQRGEKDSYEVFIDRLEIAEEKLKTGELFEVSQTTSQKRPGRAVALCEQGDVLYDSGWQDDVDMGVVYENGDFGILFGEDGICTIGKKPLFKCKPFNQEGGLVEVLGEIEPGWGGADSIMGAPRPNGTELSQETILETVKGHISKQNKKNALDNIKNKPESCDPSHSVETGSDKGLSC